MRTARRLVRDESGMTMGLAVIMIVLLGVMGAGLLTFVSRDLNTVVEENRGQRAFEVADAGIGAAKRQLASNVVRTDYDDDPNDPPVDDIQWSAAQGGLTLGDLDGDGPGGTPDSVNVTIEYIPENEQAAFPEEHFLVISTGTYGVANRRIEAIFEGVELGAGTGDGLGHPVYVTPSDIKIKNDSIDNNPVALIQVSMFTKKNILTQGVTSQAQFVTDYDDPGGAIKTQGNDELCDWNSEIRLRRDCFRSGTDTWNTTPRTILTPGMAAEGKICGFTSESTGTCSPDFASIADGVRGFDSTTTPKFEAKNCVVNCPRNEPGKISYPFPELNPVAEGFREQADVYFEGDPNTIDTNWGLNNSDNNRITFVDAENQTLTFNPGGGRTKGIIVVWCGRLLMNDDFEGIILNLIGNELPDNTQCSNTTATVSGGVPDGKTVGTYENLGRLCQCWAYAEGGTDSLSGIELDPGSRAQFRPGASWSFQSGLFEGPPPTSFALKNWRELYSLDE